MPLRLIEAWLPEARLQETLEAFGDVGVEGVWHEPAAEGRVILRVLVEATSTEAVTDELHRRFQFGRDFRVVVLAVEAALPRPQGPDGEGADGTVSSVEPRKEGRISREELYADVVDAARLSRTYLVMVLLSAIVAGVGLVKDNTAVIIGAMVIAPLLGPNVALALATTLGDRNLAKAALRSGLVGAAIAFAAAALMGALVPFDPGVLEIVRRTSVGPADLAVALASGVAGALAFTTGAPAAVIGVMVAVALMPPLVVSGLLTGAGHLDLAGRALLLLLANVISLNLAGVSTFLAKGVGPRRWWTASRARRRSWIAVLTWALLLGALAAIMVLAGTNGG